MWAELHAHALLELWPLLPWSRATDTAPGAYACMCVWTHGV